MSEPLPPPAFLNSERDLPSEIARAANYTPVSRTKPDGPPHSPSRTSRARQACRKSAALPDYRDQRDNPYNEARRHIAALSDRQRSKVSLFERALGRSKNIEEARRESGLSKRGLKSTAKVSPRPAAKARAPGRRKRAGGVSRPGGFRTLILFSTCATAAVGFTRPLSAAN